MEAGELDTLSRRLRYEGTFRLRPPSETLARVEPFLARAGITRVAVVTGLDVIGIPVVMVTRPASRSLSVTQGKGPTLEAARVSGIMEALEHHCAETLDAPLRHGSLREMSARGRTCCLPRGSVRPGAALSEHSPLTWVEGASLTDRQPVWVPHDLVHLDYRLPLAPSAASFLASSNGLASGNSELEATCHGLYEVLEREHTQRFYELAVDDQRARRVDLASVGDPVVRGLLAQLDSARVQAGVWDLSSELGVPCFLCDLLDAQRGDFRVLSRARGIGCHADRAVALTRALCEAAQSRLTLIAGSRDDISPRELAVARGAESWQRAARQLQCDDAPLRHFDACPTRAFGSFAEELHWLTQQIERAGFGTPIVVRLSDPALPFAVVRVLVPAMRAPHVHSEPSA
jgi:YcaO-like protein with predicted kinase domain